MECGACPPWRACLPQAGLSPGVWGSRRVYREAWHLAFDFVAANSSRHLGLAMRSVAASRYSAMNYKSGMLSWYIAVKKDKTGGLLCLLAGHLLCGPLVLGFTVRTENN